MPDHQDVDRGSCLIWFLAGLAVGAAIGVLVAPLSGRDTRTLISQKAQEGVGRGREFFEQSRALVDDAADLFERGRKLARGGGQV
ncbi:MAG: YtxH domain-containing protein [Bryobacteraceae bacterium]